MGIHLTIIKGGFFMKKSTGLIAIVVVVVLLLIFGVSSYNKMVGLNENVNTAYSQVQNVIQRRADLIPNLVRTVEGYADHESEVLTRITEARAGIQNAQSPQELADANEQLTGALGGLNVVVEAYPDLKANQNFIQLQDELAGTENRISVERKNYNEAVQQYNNTRNRFPMVMAAGLLGFEAKEYFEASPESQKAPEVQFN